MRTVFLILVLAAGGCGKKTVTTAPPASSLPADSSLATSDMPSIIFDKDHVVLRERSGVDRWRVHVPGYLGSVRAPDRIMVGDRVIVVADSKLVALAAQDGHKIWEAPGPADRIHVHDSIIFTTDCSSPSAMDRTRWVIGRRLADGTEAFRVEIPKSVDPDPMTELENTLFVGDARSTTVIGAVDGKKRFGLDEGLIVAHPVGDEWLLATTKRIARFGADGAVRWERPVLRDTFVGRGGVVPIDKEDVVVFGYSGIADSGVELVRLRLSDGNERWRSFAKPAGVDHSEYEHNAEVVLKGGLLVVASRGSYASFDESFTLDRGASTGRKVTKR